MLTPLTLRYATQPATRSLATNYVCDLFGLAPDEPPHTIAVGVQLDLRPGDLALFTGPSGSGKSSLLRAAAAQLPSLDVTTLTLPEVPLVDALPGSIDERLAQLAACGLSEPRVLLRTPSELSDGQRTRFRLAFAWAQKPGFLVADEFGAVLDRPLAKVLAYNLRRQVSQTGVGALVATTHDDLFEDINPDVWVQCHGDGAVTVTRRDVKKKRSVWQMDCGCRRAPVPTGRISLGGIIAVTTSPTSAASSCSGTATSPSASASSALPPPA
jgi:hypothetical protein